MKQIWLILFCMFNFCSGMEKIEESKKAIAEKADKIWGGFFKRSINKTVLCDTLHLLKNHTFVSEITEYIFKQEVPSSKYRKHAKYRSFLLVKCYGELLKPYNKQWPTIDLVQKREKAQTSKSSLIHDLELQKNKIAWHDWDSLVTEAERLNKTDGQKIADDANKLFNKR